jgi:hypothetical protein
VEFSRRLRRRAARAWSLASLDPDTSYFIAAAGPCPRASVGACDAKMRERLILFALIS